MPLMTGRQSYSNYTGLLVFPICSTRRRNIYGRTRRFTANTYPIVNNTVDKTFSLQDTDYCHTSITTKHGMITSKVFPTGNAKSYELIQPLGKQHWKIGCNCTKCRYNSYSPKAPLKVHSLHSTITDTTKLITITNSTSSRYSCCCPTSSRSLNSPGSISNGSKNDSSLYIWPAISMKYRKDTLSHWSLETSIIQLLWILSKPQQWNMLSIGSFFYKVLLNSYQNFIEKNSSCALL